MTLSFWANYVLAAERQNGTPREVSLSRIEAKYGTAVRQSIEAELAAYDAEQNGGAADGGNPAQPIE